MTGAHHKIADRAEIRERPHPQATHHIVHRSVWQTTADNGVVLLASPRIPPAEKARLRAEHERSTRVLEEIDAAAGKAG